MAWRWPITRRTRCCPSAIAPCATWCSTPRRAATRRTKAGSLGGLPAAVAHKGLRPVLRALAGVIIAGAAGVARGSVLAILLAGPARPRYRSLTRGLAEEDRGRDMSDVRLDLGPLAAMGAVRTALDSLTLTGRDRGRNLTKAVKTKLCERGRELGCQVSASIKDFGKKEWLYDVIWTEYSQGYEPSTQNQLIAVHLVAECEWGDFTDIKKDFEKLLLARATLRLMIYDGNRDPGSLAIADQLAKYVAGFRDTVDPDAWLFAALERDADTGCCSFRFFGRSGSFGLFAPGVDWPDHPDLETMIRQSEAIEAEIRRDREERTARQGPPPPPSQRLLISPEKLLHRKT